MAIEQGQAELSGVAIVAAVGSRILSQPSVTVLFGTATVEAVQTMDFVGYAILTGSAWITADPTIEYAAGTSYVRTRHKAYQVNPEAATIGQVLTADGLGDADWENPGMAVAFTDLIDTPGSYAGEGGKVVSVKATVDGLEFTSKIDGSGADKYVAFFDGPSSIIGSANFQWDGSLLWLDRVIHEHWDTGRPPDFGIQSERPAVALCQDVGSNQQTVVLYLSDDEILRLAWTPFRGVGVGGDATDWGYDDKVDFITMEPSIGWVGIGVGLVGSSYTLQLSDDCTDPWANRAGQAQLALTGLTHTNLGLYMGVDTANEIARLQGASGAETAMDIVLQPAGGNVGLGAIPTANMEGLSIEAGLLTLKERTTPTADAGYGKIWPESNNTLHFQDGAGVDHELAYSGAAGGGEMDELFLARW